MPDTPEEPGFAPAAEVPGQLSAASIREVWPEIMTAVSRKSKKIAALAQGATVRDLEGQTVVLTFRFPAHAKMVAAEPALISDALYEALGGRWQIRCDVAGESGPSPGSGGSAPRSPRGGPSGPAQRSPQSQDTPAGPAQRSPQSQDGLPAAPQQPAAAQDAPSRQEVSRTASSAAGAPARQREAAPRASAAVESDAGDEWPEPARPGGLATAVAAQVVEAPPEEDEEWPETARPGGNAGPAFVDPSVGQSGAAVDDFGGAGGGQGFGGSAAAAGGPASGGLAAGGSASGGLAAGGSASGGLAAGGPASGGPMVDGPAAGGPAAGGSAVGGSAAGGFTAGGSAVGGRAAPTSSPAGTDPVIVGNGHGSTTGQRGTPSDPVSAPGAHGAPAPTTGGTPARSEPTPAAAPSAAGARNAPPAAAVTPPARPASSGLAAARAAAAGAGRGTNAGAAVKTGVWSDGSPAEEAPYDPEYDGPPRAVGGGRSFEGFDPGDEPLDVVIDEKTARQSSEQQAVQLLRDALGAEKISES